MENIKYLSPRGNALYAFYQMIQNCSRKEVQIMVGQIESSRNHLTSYYAWQQFTFSFNAYGCAQISSELQKTNTEHKLYFRCKFKCKILHEFVSISSHD